MTDIAVETTSTGSADEIAAEWISAFGRVLECEDVDGVASLFAEDCWWRDTLALTWDLRSLRGIENIVAMLSELLPGSGLHEFALTDGKTQEYVDVTESRLGINAFFTFRTRVAHGCGVVRLVDENGRFKAWTVLTDMRDLIGHEERRTSIAAAANHEYTDAVEGRLTWPEFRERQREFVDREPTVLVVGAGHSGVMLAARLEHLGVPTLVIDKNARLGDNWRLRYHSLALHDTCWNSRFPYLPYPDNWPVFAPKDMIADWIESYVWMLQLNAWTMTEIVKADFDEAAGRWTAIVRRNGVERTLHPAHLVFATGNSGVSWMPEVPGAEKFKGEIVHSSRHIGGERQAGKKVVVVGSATSAHDVSQDAYEMGAESVTMVQRGDTYVMSAKNGAPVFFGELWSENSPPTEDADRLSASLPYHLHGILAVEGTKLIAELDKELLDGLERAGFGLDFGENWSGLISKAMKRAGGYYIDKGCSQLIVDGKIRIQRGEIAEFTEDGVIYSDGTSEKADIVVFATGWENMREAARPICGNEITDRLSLVWGQDEEGELRGVNRPSGHPRLWFMAGGFQISRFHSRHLALQIQATELGLR